MDGPYGPSILTLDRSLQTGPFIGIQFSMNYFLIQVLGYFGIRQNNGRAKGVRQTHWRFGYTDSESTGFAIFHGGNFCYVFWSYFSRYCDNVVKVSLILCPYT